MTAATLSPRYISPEYAALLASIEQGLAEGERRHAAKAKPQVSALCAAKEEKPPRKPEKGPVILGGAQSPDQPKRQSKRDLRHVMTTIKERHRKYVAETGFDAVTCEMVEPPMEQWDRPEAMPLYWKMIVSGDSTPPLSSLSPGDQELARWMHDEELITIGADESIRCLSDCADTEQRRYPGSPLPDPCHRKDGTCTFHTSGPCPKIAFTGGPYHAAVGKYLADRAGQLVLDAWSAIRAGRPYAQVAASQRHEMTRPGGIRISTREICHHANARLAQLKALHPEEWAEYRYMSTDVAERAVKDLLEDGELVQEEKPYLTRIGHTDIGVPRTYGVDDMAGWLAYANAGNPRKRGLKIPRWLRRSSLQEAA